jgi:hypothetical protein
VENLTQLLNWLTRFVNEWSEVLKTKMHEASLTGTLGTLLIVLLLVVLTLYLSQWGLYLLQKILEVARLLLKVVALLVVVVAVLAGGRYAWDWLKASERTCTGAFFEKVIPCKPLDLTPKAAGTSSEFKNAVSVKKDRNAVKPSVKEKSRKVCKDKKEQKAHPKYRCVLEKET